MLYNRNLKTEMLGSIIEQGGPAHPTTSPTPLPYGRPAVHVFICTHLNLQDYILEDLGLAELYLKLLWQKNKTTIRTRHHESSSVHALVLVGLGYF